MAISRCAPSFACRYNLRDIGFIDLGEQPYVLEMNPSPGFDDTSVPRFQFHDSNITIRIQDTGAQGDEPTDNVLPPVLRHPDGRELLLTGARFSDLSDAATSCGLDISATIVDKLLECHSIVLVVQGDDSEQNTQTSRHIEQVIEAVMATRDLWPKPITNPPEIVTIDREQRTSQRALLWALELDSQSTAPQVAVLFGRARRLGPVLRGNLQSSHRLERLLQLVTVDCECGLDLASVVGPMIPHVWTARHEQRAVEELGFDPGSPLVQVEVDRIRSKWTTSDGPTASLTPEIQDPLWGYQEIALPAVPTNGGEPTQATLPTTNGDAAKPITNMAPTAVATESVDRRSGPITGLAVTMALLLLVTVAGSIFVLWRRPA